jgi:hypothetical protein
MKSSVLVISVTSRKFNTLCFLSMVATLKLSVMGAGLVPDKEQPSLFPTGARIPEVY